MKRPIGVYAIAILLFLQKPLAVTVPIQLLMGAPGPWPAELRMITTVALIAIGVGVVQLRRIPRILTISLLVISCAVCGRLLANIILAGGTILPSGQAAPLRLFVTLPGIVVLNVWSIWYLSRKRFARYCADYRNHVEAAEQERERQRSMEHILKNPPTL